MSRRSVAPLLHLEWSGTQVRAVDIGKKETAVANSVSELGAITHGHREALVGIARNLVFMKALRLPKAPAAQLRLVIGVQLGQFLPLPADQLAWDFIQTTDQTSEGLLTIIAAIRAEDLRQLREELKAAGITATRILPVALGAPAVAAHTGEGFRDALVMERFHGTTTFDVVQDGMVRFTRVTLTDGDSAGEAKRTLIAAGADGLPLISVGNEPWVSGSLPSHDGGSSLSRLDEAPPFAFELADEREREIAQRRAGRTRLAGLLTMSALLLVTLIWADRSDALAVVVRGQGSWTQQLNKLRSIRSFETDKAAEESEIQTSVTRAFQPAQPVSDILAVVGDSLPPGAWLTGLSCERGKPLQIRGTAKTSEDVGLFVSKLGGSSRFRDVRLVFANSAKIDALPVVQFNVTAVAIGNLPMPEPPKAKSKTAKRATPASSATDTTQNGAPTQ